MRSDTINKWSGIQWGRVGSAGCAVFDLAAELLFSPEITEEL